MKKIVDGILRKGIQQDASHIHIEPDEKSVVVKFRIQGELRQTANLSKKNMSNVFEYLKKLSELKEADSRLPRQTNFIFNKTYILFSYLPVIDGQKITLHLFNPKRQIMSLEKLGFGKNDLKIVKKNLFKTQGVNIIVGDKKSNLNKTIYSFLEILNQPGIKIGTVEEYMKYNLPNSVQTYINPKIGYNYQTGTKSFLNNKDIIFVEKILDKKTAEAILNAGITGHLILTTLPVKNIEQAFYYLKNLKVDPFLIASALNLIIAQDKNYKVFENTSETAELILKNAPIEKIIKKS